MPYRCRACRRYFSVRIGTALERSKVPFRKWAFAIYQELTNLKGVSSMNLHRDLNMMQETVWFMIHCMGSVVARVPRLICWPR